MSDVSGDYRRVCWPLAKSIALQTFRCAGLSILLGAGCWVLGAGCWVLGAGCWVLGANYCAALPNNSCAGYFNASVRLGRLFFGHQKVHYL
jgi:hypothetical protein